MQLWASETISDFKLRQYKGEEWMEIGKLPPSSSHLKAIKISKTTHYTQSRILLRMM